LESWTEKFIESGSRLTLYRLRGLAEIRRSVKEYHRWISGTKEEMECTYWGYGTGQKTGEELEERAIAEELAGVLRRQRGEELRRGMSLAGPHRDDLILTMNTHPGAPAGNPGPKGVNLRIYGSQGQQRTAAL